MKPSVHITNRFAGRLLAARLAGVLLLLYCLPTHGIARGQEGRNDCRQKIAMNRDAASSTSPIIVTMAELEKNPGDYYGKTVTVDAELHRSFSDNVFTIEDDGFVRDRDILVITT